MAQPITPSGTDTPGAGTSAGRSGRIHLPMGLSASSFDRATRLAAQLLDVPTSLVSFVERDRQVFKSRVGLATLPPGQDETPLSQSFCRIVVERDAALVIRDAADDPDFAHHGAHAELGAVAYLGVPLHDPDGRALGALCAISDTARDWTSEELSLIRDLADTVETEIALRHRTGELERQKETFRIVLDELPIGVGVAERGTGRLILSNRTASEMLVDPLDDLEAAQSYARLGAEHPDGRRMRPEEYPILRAAIGGERVDNMPIMYRRYDGAVMDLEVAAAPVNTTPPLAVVTFADVTERRRAEAELRARDAHIARFHEVTSDGIIEIDAKNRICFANGAVRARAGAMQGEAVADTIVGRPIWDIVPDDESRALRGALGRARTSGKIEVLDLETDHDTVLELRLFPDGDTLLVYLRDVTEMRRLSESRRLLTQELAHRVKNLFAIVSGMIGMTARVSDSPQAMGRALRDRVQALSRAHDLIRPALDDEARIEDVAVSALVTSVISPHLRHAADAFQVSGPALVLTAQGVTNMALVIHELATNAAKYGALSVPHGRLTISWAVVDGDLIVNWTEEDGPDHSALPKDRGFGSQLIDLVVEGQWRGAFTQTWPANGHAATIRAPVALVLGARPI